MGFMYSEQILGELARSIGTIEEDQVQALAGLILQADRIFLDGLGRSGLCGRAFAMRLTHLGLKSCVVGETVTPSITDRDLLMICSGSGESKSLCYHAQTAKSRGAALVVITTNGQSSLGNLADVCIRTAAPQKEQSGSGCETILPLGSLFEGTAALLFENLVLLLMDRLKESSASMFKRHANLE